MKEPHLNIYKLWKFRNDPDEDRPDDLLSLVEPF